MYEELEKILRIYANCADYFAGLSTLSVDNALLSVDRKEYQNLGRRNKNGEVDP